MLVIRLLLKSLLPSVVWRCGGATDVSVGSVYILCTFWLVLLKNIPVAIQFNQA